MRIRPVCRFCRQVMTTVDIPEGADHIHHTCPLCGERGPVYLWDDWLHTPSDVTDAWAWTPGRIAVLVIAIGVVVAITLLGAL